MATKIDFTKKKKENPTVTDTLSASSTIQKLKKIETEEQALEEIKTKEFYDTLRSYYTYRDGESEITSRGFNKFSEMSHADLLEYFYNDRSWRNNNTGAMTKDLANAFTDSAERNAQLAYISSTYHALPSFWNSMAPSSAKHCSYTCFFTNVVACLNRQ